MLKILAKRLLIVFILAVSIEAILFQMPYWSMRWNNIPINVVYSMEDFEAEGWEKTEAGLVSQGGQHFFLRGIDTEIKTIDVSAQISPTPDYILLFYTTEDGELFSDSKCVLCSNESQTKLDQHVRDIRLDFSNVPGLELENFSIVINRAAFNFSWSRVIAILMIYLTAKVLFYIQRPMNYQIDE